MKKLILSILAIILCITHATAQKELWAMTYEGGSPENTGAIFKANFDGSDPQFVHLFDAMTGMKPYGKLLLASNGKLYGTASKGGMVLSPTETGGVLFEYDLELSIYSVVIYFGSAQLPNTSLPESGIIEPIPGILYGSLVNGGIFSYNLNTETATIIATIPSFNSQLQLIRNQISGELTKASDGNIYGTTKYYSSSPNGAPYIGAVAKLNMANNSFSIPHPLNSTGGDGIFPQGNLVEASPGKLYGTTIFGGTTATNLINNDGVLFEYNTVTNSYTKKFSFNSSINGAHPGTLTMGSNNKLYGILVDGGHGYNPFDPNQHHGALYEYNIQTNTVTTVYDFGYDSTGNNFGVGAKGGLLKASDDNLYGISSSGIFRFNPNSNTLTQYCTACSLSNLFLQVGSDLIEICRKPAYHSFDVDTFDACAGGTFTYDIQNTNATTYQWLNDGTVVPGQTTGILSLTSVSASDAGNYTCVMTNECGTTTTMVLHLTVNCLGTDNVANLDESIKLYPNPAKDLLNVTLPENIAVTITSNRISNSLGQIIQEQTTLENNIIDVSHLQTGIYFISLVTNYGNWSGKFVKE